MAGDLLLAFCRPPRTPDGQLAPEYLARPAIAARIDALPREVIEEVAIHTFGEMAERDCCVECGGVVKPHATRFIHADHTDVDHEARIGDRFDAVTPGEHAVRKTLHAAIDSLFRENRVCYPVYLDGIWIVSGGISGGDSPTDEYDDLRALALSGVTVEPIPAAATDSAS